MSCHGSLDTAGSDTAVSTPNGPSWVGGFDTLFIVPEARISRLAHIL